METAVSYERLPSHVKSAPRKRKLPLRTTMVTLVLSAVVSSIVIVVFTRVRLADSGELNQTTSLHDDVSVVSSQPRVIKSFNVSNAVINHLDKVNVSFAYAEPFPSSLDIAGDWIGVYCLENTTTTTTTIIDGNASLTMPVVDYIDRRDTRGAIESTIEFGPLVNMRCSLQFKLVTSDNVVLASSTVVRFREGPTEPLQVHLSMANKASEMRVMWTSAALPVGTAQVRYGTHPNALDRVASATNTTYDASDMCAEPATTRGPRAFRDPGAIYDALMTDLQANETYYYQVGGNQTSWSQVRQFQLPPPVAGMSVPSEDDKPLDLFVFGDLMTATDATSDFRLAGGCGTTMQLIERDLNQGQDKYAALIHVGDLSYSSGKTYVWDQFAALIEPVASRIPYMVSIGNHDFGYLEGRGVKDDRAPPHPAFEADGTHGHDAYGECGVPSERRFHMPENGDGIWWYSMEIGLTHHVVLSGEHDFTAGSPMNTWLLADLQSVDRSKTPWLFVHIHRSLYCSVAFNGDYQRSLLFRDHLEALFAEYHVDVVFSGHYHSYERTCPVYDEACYYGENGEAEAPVHIMVGSGGANVDTFGHYSVGWSEFARMAYGYGRVHVHNATHMHFEFVANDVGDVQDEAWIVSSHDWPSDRLRWRRYFLNPSLASRIIAGVGVLLLIGLWIRLHMRRRKADKVHQKQSVLIE
ncbi:hypothetical protein Poli38472_009516 [Pythium oligandrum]|uniref:Purple acid phosphatase n=1 Tax=Pythium oligandrum TaxID=41045 RepID=A0A8K1FKT2_PYTOL|nr:hypothetical protein Poli38472_009516 [Pythium oligandrum]|eukprot:TMW62023.1 hypothetical protein Poli38472_009516 [Pythium oligandrum]